MANRSERAGLRRLTRGELIAGWLYLPFYLVLLQFGLVWLFAEMRWEPTDVQRNIVYFSVNLAAVLVIFHRFLRQPFFGGGFWNFIQALILGGVMYYAGNWLLTTAVSLLKLDVTRFNDEAVSALVRENRPVMLVISILAAPIIEETLIRGLAFGSIRQLSRPAAYIVATLLFMFMHTWQFALTQELSSVLLCAALYIPASASLCWTYEKAGSIWAPIALHAICNAVAYGVVTLS